MSISENTIGVDIEAAYTPGTSLFQPAFRTGTVIDAIGGGRYMYAVASTAISGGNSSVNITESGGVYSAAASGGSSTSPATALASGDYAWFLLA